MVKEHVIERTIHETFVDPDHVSRHESEEFRKSKERLKEDGHYQCWVCGTKEDLQCHHFGSEWMFANLVDFEKLKVFVEEWDPYGYGRLLKNKPITTVDDVRNMLYLCQGHHTGVDHKDGRAGTGIHEIPFPEWIMQKLALPGANPVPQKGETVEQAMKRVEAYERK